MLRRIAAAIVSAVVVAVSSGTAEAGIRPLTIPWWQMTVFALGPKDAYVAEYMGYSQGWVVIGGPASNLYVGSAGVFATDPTTGDICQWNGTTGSAGWTVIGGPGQTFVQSQGHLYGLGPGGSYVAEYNGTPGSWTIVYGQTTELAGGGDGLVVVDSDGQGVSLYNGTPGSWTQIGGWQFGAGTQFAVGGANIWALDPFGNIDQWSGSGQSWSLIGENDDSGIFANGDHLYATLYNGGAVQQYTGTPGYWTLIGSTGYQFAVSRTTLYRLAPNLSSVALYTNGVGWSTIGGPGAAIAADSDAPA
jgi:hypothetical protein